MRLVTEECERKIQARWEEERSEIRALKTEKHQLQRVIEAMAEKGTATQAVVRDLPGVLTIHYSCDFLRTATNFHINSFSK